MWRPWRIVSQGERDRRESVTGVVDQVGKQHGAARGGVDDRRRSRDAKAGRARGMVVVAVVREVSTGPRRRSDD